MTFGTEYVLNNMRRSGFTVVNTHLVKVETVAFAIVPRAHDMTRARVVKIDHHFVVYPVVPFCHVPTCLSGFGTVLSRFRPELSAGARLRGAGFPWPF